MKKIIFTILVCLTTLSSIFAQQKEFEWRLGVSGGYTNYYGDLSPNRIRGLSNSDAIHHLFYFNENYFDQYSFKISLEKSLSPTVGIQFSYGQYQFSMSDRYIQRNGELLASARNFDRALNFQNNSRDMGVSLVFKADNDKFLSSKSILAPYFTLGFGFLDFDISGDLLDDDGNRYNYSNPSTVNNRNYETELSPLRTELANGYDLGTFYANFGLGIRLKLGKRFEVFAQSDFIHSFSDYLDDVSGTYRTSYDNDFQAYAAKPGPNVVDPTTLNRGKNNGLNDWVIYHGVGLKFNFGASKTSFSAPRLSTSYPQYGQVRQIETPKRKTELQKPEDVIEVQKEDTIQVEKSGNTYNYYTNIQMVDQSWRDSLDYKTKVLTWDQQIANRRGQIFSSKLEERSLLDTQKRLAERRVIMERDTLLSASEKDSLRLSSEKESFNIRYSLDSIQNKKAQFEAEIDSISKLKNDYQIQSQIRSFLPYRIDSTFGNTDSLFPNTYGINSPQEIDNLLTDKANFEKDSTLGLSKKDSVLKKSENSVLQRAYSVNTENEQFRTDLDQEFQKKNADQINRIQELELESRRLKAERDSLNALPRQMIYMGSRNLDPNLSERSQNTVPERITNTTNNETIIRERVVQQQPVRTRERNRGGFWRTIGAFFGGAAVTKAVSSNQQQEPENSSNAVAQNTAIDMEAIERANLAAVTWGFINLGIDQGELNRLSKATSLEKEESMATNSSEDTNPKIITEQVTITDTVFVDNDPVIKLLKSKEIIYFKINQREPELEQIQKLGNLVDFIKENDGYKLLLTGYADNTGNVAYNLKLADERMKAVASIIENNFGLNASKIIFESGGQVVRGAQRSSNDLDRKVEVRIEASN